MNHFSIRDIENLCGIRAHTLRIWEQRYNLCVAKRRDSRQRYYDNEDLKVLLRISYLYHQGYKISRIAGLDAEGIKNAVTEVTGRDNMDEYAIHQLLEASVDFDKERFEEVVSRFVDRLGLEKAVFQVFYPFLQRIGLLWLTNHVIPAQEHFCSHIIQKKIIAAIDGLEPVTTPLCTALLFTPVGEYHELPLLAADYLLKKNRIRTGYFGANTRIEHLHMYASQQPFDLLFTHIFGCTKDCSVEKYLDKLAKEFPGKPILAAGPAGKKMETTPEGVTVLSGPNELIRTVQKLIRDKQPVT